MKYTFLFLIITAIIRCGQSSDSMYIDGFEKYYDTFAEKTNTYTTRLSIQFGSLPKTQFGKLVGYCILDQEIPKVIIDKASWLEYSEADRQELISHELGHCLLRRQHDDRLLSNGLPASIMNSYHFDGNILENNKEYYYKELKELR